MKIGRRISRMGKGLRDGEEALHNVIYFLYLVEVSDALLWEKFDFFCIMDYNRRMKQKIYE